MSKVTKKGHVEVTLSWVFNTSPSMPLGLFLGIAGCHCNLVGNSSTFFLIE